VACDLTDADATARAVQAAKPDLVIHAQALSDADWCEQHPDEATRQNVAAMRNLADALRGTSAWLIAVSSDYVFDGRLGRPYDETDAPAPISVYGHSKHAAEREARGYGRGVIARTSTLFGPGRRNFCDMIVAALQAGEPVDAFEDQTTSPSYTIDVARALDELGKHLMATPGAPRTYHVTNGGAATRVEFATRVADELGLPAGLIRPIRMADQRRPARRPAYSALTTIHNVPTMRRVLRPWHDALEAHLAPLR
jgi:dTDP-4-dehydrorhamnose reductase